MKRLRFSWIQLKLKRLRFSFNFESYPNIAQPQWQWHLIESNIAWLEIRIYYEFLKLGWRKILKDYQSERALSKGLDETYK